MKLIKNRFFPFLTIISTIVFIFFSVNGVKIIKSLEKFNIVKNENKLVLLSQDEASVDLSNNNLIDNGVLLFRANNSIYFWSDIEVKIKRYHLEVPFSWRNNKIKLTGDQGVDKLLPKFNKYSNLRQVPVIINLASQIIYTHGIQDTVRTVIVYY